MGKPLGLDFSDLGKRQHGTAATLYFCDKLYEIYGSDDPSLALGASFAIEHWANGGFWDRLLSGFEELNRSGRLPAKTPLGFWRFHSVLEAQHASHTMDELEEQKKKNIFTHAHSLPPEDPPPRTRHTTGLHSYHPPHPEPNPNFIPPPNPHSISPQPPPPAITPYSQLPLPLPPPPNPTAHLLPTPPVKEAIKAGRVTDEATFERGAVEMLNACAVFWEGLDAHRRGESEYEPPQHVSLVQ